MEEGFANEVTDLLKEAMGDIQLEIRDMFKGTRPFRQPMLTDSQKVDQYMNLDPRVAEALMQQAPEGWTKYQENMNKLMGRS